MMVHPAPWDAHDGAGLAVEEWAVTVTGRASHASAEPHLGRNALDGVVAGYTAIAMLRQHLRPHQQVHGIITHGGDAPNVVPERAAASYYLRAIDVDDLVDLRARVRACLDGAALATGTDGGGRRGRARLRAGPQNPGLVRAFGLACEAIGRPYTPDPAGDELGGSTDFGNVSQLVPAVHPNLAVHSWPAVNHQHEFAAHCVGPDGDRTLLDGAKAMALTALAVAADPQLLAEP